MGRPAAGFALLLLLLLQALARDLEPPSAGGAPRPSSANCTWLQYEQPLSHLEPGATSDTYLQRVCIYDGYWDKGRPGAPILFYVGNESPVDEYVNATGLMWENAPKLGALLVWAEHRYFGESVPELEGRRHCLAWLSTLEAMADYAVLIDQFQRNQSYTNKGV